MQEHWNQVYETKPTDGVSWFQAVPVTSLTLLESTGLDAASCVIDVGGGDSRLVDSLLDLGLECITVLDISAAAIARAQDRLGARAARVHWIVADVTAEWAAPTVDFWHDRAVFHFLVEQADRDRYVARLGQAVKPGGHAAIATFAPDGPTRCSGLPVMRYSSETLVQQLGHCFELVRSFTEPHVTPMGTTQSFLFALIRRMP